MAANEGMGGTGGPSGSDSEQNFADRGGWGSNDAWGLSSWAAVLEQEDWDMGTALGYGDLAGDAYSNALQQPSGLKAALSTAFTAMRQAISGPAGLVEAGFTVADAIKSWNAQSTQAKNAAYAAAEKQGFSREQVDAALSAAKADVSAGRGDVSLGDYTRTGGGSGGGSASIAQYLPKGSQSQIDAALKAGTPFDQLLARYYVNPRNSEGGNQANQAEVAYLLLKNQEMGGALPSDANWGYWTDQALKDLGITRDQLAGMPAGSASQVATGGANALTGVAGTGATGATTTTPAAGGGGSAGGQYSGTWLEPWIRGGTQAQNALADQIMAGPGDYTKSPGYDFRLNEGMNQLLRAQAAKGQLNSGATDKAAIQYGQNYATADYDNFLRRYYDSLDPMFKMSGLGQNSAVAEGNWANQMAAQNANLDWQKEQARDAYSQQQTQNWMDVLGTWASGGFGNLLGTQNTGAQPSGYQSSYPSVNQLASWWGSQPQYSTFSDPANMW